MQNRWNLLALLILTAMPVSGQTSKPKYLSSADRMCKATFFRSRRSEFDARPTIFEPLVSAKKVGSHWELQIKGPDEPNRATVWLDSNFKFTPYLPEK